MKAKQISILSSLIGSSAPVTKSSSFLEEMDQIVPFEKLSELISGHIKENTRGRKRKETELMLRCLCLQQWYGLSDPALEDAINDRISFQRFLNLDITTEQAPDETTITKFRHFMEKNNLFKKAFEEINQFLESKDLILKKGTLVDATIIKAPSSTKNNSKQRDPEMGSTKKGNQFHFGMKAHIGVDQGSNIIHSVTFSSASVHDSQLIEELIHGEEEVVFADKAYRSEAIDEMLEKKDITSMILHKSARNKPLSEAAQAMNKLLSTFRAPVEFPFGIVKNLWGYRKVRYKGIYKNACQQYFLFGLANLFTSRKKILAEI